MEALGAKISSEEAALAVQESIAAAKNQTQMDIATLNAVVREDVAEIGAAARSNGATQ